MYRIAVCDDDAIYLEHQNKLIKSILLERNIQHEISLFTTAEELLRTLKQKEFDIFILDIVLPDANGVDLAMEIRKVYRHASILFISSTADYSLSGYSVYPIHYLIKPVTREKLAEVIDREYNEHFLARHIFLPVKHGEHIVRIDTILFIEVQNKLIRVNCTNEQLEYTGTLQKLVKLLPDTDFVRCHKSFIVNIKNISEINSNKLMGKAMLKTGASVPIGRTYFDEVKKKLVQYYSQIED